MSFTVRFTAKPKDIVTLVDGRKGVVEDLSHWDGDITVMFPDHPELKGPGNGCRLYNSRGKHTYNEVPDILTIHTPGTETTMTQTPYDAEIARAEKALADLKAKAVAEAAAAVKPVRELAVGQKWKTRDGRTVRIERKILGDHNGKPCFHASGIPYWYASHTTITTAHAPGTLTEASEFTLVEYVGEATRRWYTDAEFVQLALTFPAFVLARKVGETRPTGTIRPDYDGSSSSGYYFYHMSCANIYRSNFLGHEFSTDGGKTWNKFGVEE